MRVILWTIFLFSFYSPKIDMAFKITIEFGMDYY
jgi:hypothetical protein